MSLPLCSMSGIKPDDPFLSFVAKNRSPGRDGHETQQPYISSTTLRDYWEIDVIERYVHRHVVDTERIRQRYLKVLSTLVIINGVEYIEVFIHHGLDDTRLPLRERPTEIATPSIPSHCWDSFYNAQWQFCPVEFSLPHENLPGHVLDPKQIWPIKDVEPLTGGQDEVVKSSKVTVDRGCIQLSVHHDSNCVFKEYFTDQGYSLFQNEIAAYKSLARYNSSAIIRCYSWFEQAGKYTIILEYAELGSLIDYWRTTHEPSRKEDIDTLWSNFFELSKGLAFIHGNPPPTRDRESLRMFGMHSDIKPGNILVMKKAGSSNPYDVDFKIADFGLSRTRPVIASHPNPIDTDSGGSRMYNPPETTRRSDWTESLSIEVGKPLDIWGMGCVFSEMVSWVVGGEPERKRYRQLRKEKTPKQLEDAGYCACFHDGEVPLPLVREYHETTLLQSYRFGDSKSRQVGEMVVRRMLLKEPDSRLSAMQLYWDTKRLDELYPFDEVKFKTKLSRPDPHTPPSHHTTTSHSRGSSGDMGDRSNFSPTQGSPLRDGGSPLTPVSDRSPYQGQISHTLPNRPYLNNLPESAHPSYQSNEPDIYTSPRLPQDHLAPTKVWQRSFSQRLPNGAAMPHKESYFGNLPGSNQQSLERTNTIPSRSVYGQYSFDTSKDNPSTYYLDGGGAVEEREAREDPTSPETQATGNGLLPLAQGVQDPRREALMRQKTEREDKISYETILQWKAEKRNPSKPISSIFGSSKANSMNKSCLRRLDRAKETLGTRELIFVIDDSEAMRKHWTSVVNFFKALYYETKSLDPNGIDVYFTSEPSRSYREKWPMKGKLIEKIEKRSFREGLCPMEKCLSERFTDIRKDIDRSRAAAKKTSLFVLTNGHWSPNNADKACGVAILIRDMVNKLAHETLDRFQVSLQFVRFTEDNVGTPRLKYLDDDIKGEYQLEYDIVDQRYFDEDVCSILMGPLDRDNDEYL